jgi:nucleoid-associated protein YgaU
MVPPADAPTIDATPAGPTLAPHVHIVGRGDHLWAIARDTLEDALGRAPNDAEISAYWRRLIDQNRSRLVDPDNPDLIFAGQELILPAT